MDLEEFDLPIEYHLTITKKRQLEVTTEGLIAVLALLKAHSVIATFFTTAYYAENNSELIKKLWMKATNLPRIFAIILTIIRTMFYLQNKSLKRFQVLKSLEFEAQDLRH